jgi:hypothetical protein
MNTFPIISVLDQNNVVINIGIIEDIEPISSIVDLGISEVTSIIYSNIPDSLVVNEPVIGYTLDTILNAFIPPKPDPTYILNTTTYQWEPDPSLTYDLHNDGKLYKYDLENICWIPTWENDSIGIRTI